MVLVVAFYYTPKGVMTFICYTSDDYFQSVHSCLCACHNDDTWNVIPYFRDVSIYSLTILIYTIIYSSIFTVMPLPETFSYALHCFCIFFLLLEVVASILPKNGLLHTPHSLYSMHRHVIHQPCFHSIWSSH